MSLDELRKQFQEASNNLAESKAALTAADSKFQADQQTFTNLEEAIALEENRLEAQAREKQLTAAQKRAKELTKLCNDAIRVLITCFPELVQLCRDLDIAKDVGKYLIDIRKLPWGFFEDGSGKIDFHRCTDAQTASREFVKARWPHAFEEMPTRQDLGL